MKKIYTKTAFVILALMLVMIAVCGCYGEKDAPATTAPSTSVALTTDKKGLEIEYPSHDGETLRRVLSDRYEDFQTEVEYHTTVCYLNKEKTKYEIYYSYSYKAIYFTGAFTVLVDNGYIQAIRDIRDDSYSEFDTMIKNETEEECISYYHLENKENIKDIVDKSIHLMIETLAQSSPNNPRETIAYYELFPECNRGEYYFCVWYTPVSRMFEVKYPYYTDEASK